MMLLCTNLGNLWVTLFHQIYKYTFPKRKYSIYNSKNPPKYHPVDMFCHKKYMVRFMVLTILNSPNPELNLRFGSGILVNCELNLWFGSGWFRFEPKFRTELFHHYSLPNEPTFRTFNNVTVTTDVIDQASNLPPKSNISTLGTTAALL